MLAAENCVRGKIILVTQLDFVHSSRVAEQIRHVKEEGTGDFLNLASQGRCLQYGLGLKLTRFSGSSHGMRNERKRASGSGKYDAARGEDTDPARGGGARECQQQVAGKLFGCARATEANRTLVTEARVCVRDQMGTSARLTRRAGGDQGPAGPLP